MKCPIHTISALILSLSLLLSCGGGGSEEGLLTRLDALVEADADSALVVMGRTQSEDWSRRDAMRLELLRAKAMNRADSLFTTDSLMLRVAEYYRRHGSQNDRMLSLYLLGCTYRDMGAAPRAIETWQQAVAEADTTASDCDLSTLMRIHSQMNGLYTRQRLPEYAQQEIEKAEAICWKMGDTLNALIFEEKKCGLLFTEGQYEDCIKATERVYNHFLQCGYRDDAVLSLYNCIKSCLTLGYYSEAKRYLDLYKSCSFFSTDQRKVNGGLGQPLIYEGQFYLGIGMTDSAEYYFRKALPHKNKRTNSLFIFKGLYQVYSMMNKPDSALKYMSLYSEAKERDFYNAAAQATINAKNLYDYSVEQKISIEEKEKKAQWRINFLIFALIVLLCTGVGIFFFMRYQNKIERELHKKELELSRQEAESKVLQAELFEIEKNLDAKNLELTAFLKKKVELEERNSELNNSLDYERKENIQERERLQIKIRELMKTIELMKLQKNNLEQAMSTMNFEKKMEKLRTFPILILARKHLINPKQSPFYDAYWGKIKNHVEDLFPTFYSVTHTKGNISEDEYRVCLLTKAGFSVSEINVLMEKTEYASNTKKRLLKKIFGIDGKPAEFDQHIAAIV